jgi:hypothetical protein
MMASKLTLTIAGQDAGQSAELMVTEEFDQVIEHIAPIVQPQTAMAVREMCTYNKADGTGRLWIPPPIIGFVEENAEED